MNSEPVPELFGLPEYLRACPEFLSRGGLVSLLGFGGDFGGQVDDFAAVIGAAIHADPVTLMQSLTILAFGEPHNGEAMMRPSIVAMGSRGAHSVNHDNNITYLGILRKGKAFVFFVVKNQ